MEVAAVQRSLLTIALVLAILVVITGGACLACSNAIPKQSAHGCCHSTKCPQPVRKAPVHQQCSTPVATDLANLYRLSNALLVHSGAVALAPIPQENLNIVPPQPRSRFVLARSRHYSTPDLCLLNSVFTI